MAKIVLVGDDNRGVAEMIKRYLTPYGFEVWTAHTWLMIREANEHEPNKPHCYIMDAMDIGSNPPGIQLASDIAIKLLKPVIWTSSRYPPPTGTHYVPKGSEHFTRILIEKVIELIGQP